MKLYQVRVWISVDGDGKPVGTHEMIVGQMGVVLSDGLLALVREAFEAGNEVQIAPAPGKADG